MTHPLSRVETTPGRPRGPWARSSEERPRPPLRPVGLVRQTYALCRRALRRTRPGPAHADRWLRDPWSLNGRTPPVPPRHRLRERVGDPQNNEGAGGASPELRPRRLPSVSPIPDPLQIEPPARCPLPDPQTRQESEVPQLPKGTFLKPFKKHFPPRPLRPARRVESQAARPSPGPSGHLF